MVEGFSSAPCIFEYLAAEVRFGLCLDYGFEWPLWRLLLQRSVSAAATARKCCDSSVPEHQCRESPAHQSFARIAAKVRYRSEMLGIWVGIAWHDLPTRFRKSASRVTFARHSTIEDPTAPCDRHPQGPLTRSRATMRQSPRPGSQRQGAGYWIRKARIEGCGAKAGLPAVA